MALSAMMVRSAGRLQMRRRVTLLSILLPVLLMVARSSLAEEQGSVQFAEGQIWSIKSLPPTTTKVVVGRVEQFGDGTVVHVSAVDVPRPPEFDGDGEMVISHMPFDESALAASVEELLSPDASPVPGFEDGYSEWQAAQGGVFTLGVLEAIAAIFLTLQEGKPAE